MSEDAARGQVAGSAAEVYAAFFVPALFGEWPPRLLGAAEVGPGHRVLDVGCGTGIVAAAAVPRVGAEGAVVGLDPNPAMLAVARRLAEPVTWCEGVAEDLPFADASFDRVVCQFAAMFFTDRVRAFGELARVLVPDGRVAVATWSAAERSPGYAAMIRLVRRIVGPEAAEALSAPFCLGAVEDLRALLAPDFIDVEVTEQVGEARFESIPAWVHTDVRGWTLAAMVDDDQADRLVAAATEELVDVTDRAGRVRFPAPALVATGRPRCSGGG